MTQDSNDNYINMIQTSDFTLVCTLYSLGHSISGIDDSNNKRKVFLFKKNEKIDKDVKDFFENKSLVNPRDYDNSKREIKSQMFTQT